MRGFDRIQAANLLHIKAVELEAESELPYDTPSLASWMCFNAAIYLFHGEQFAREELYSRSRHPTEIMVKEKTI